MTVRNFSAFYENTVKILCDTKNYFYIWGAGTAGQSLLRQLRESPLSFRGFIDSNPEKQNHSFCGLPVFAPDTLEWNNRLKVILASLDYPDGMEQYLQTLGKEENTDYFFSNVFLSLYKMKQSGQLYLHHVNINITDQCTLRCRDCSLLIPYYKTKKQYPLPEVLDGINKLFQIVDYVQEVHLIGGEPLLYPELSELISEIGKQYRHKIGEFAIATNGTITPSREICQAAQKHKVFFTISDYTGSPAFSGRVNIPALLQHLELNSVEYRLGNKSMWFDFNTSLEDSSASITEPSAIYQDKFQKCFFRNRGLYLNKLYYCPHQYGVLRAGINTDDSEAYIDLDSSAVDKINLLQFELGFLPRGYLLQCRQCNGYERLNNHFIDAAAQLGAMEHNKK